MAPRAYWKGSLKLSLVSCPVTLYPATTSVEKTHFHMINKETGNRLKQQMVDAETGDVVEGEQKGRGYELKKGEYVEVDKEELEAVQIESTHTIDIDSFVPVDEIDQRFIDRPYYIAPDGKAGVDAFAVIRDAMKNKGRVALARIVLTNREHIIAIEPLGKGLLGIFRRHQESEGIEGHDRTRQPYPRFQGRAFRPLEIQGRVRECIEDAGQAQGRRQTGQGCRARGAAGQRHQPDGCASTKPERPGLGKAAGSLPGPANSASHRQKNASVGGTPAQGELRRGRSFHPPLEGEGRRE
jgi:Ku70/Ku80 beta-barrel domain